MKNWNRREFLSASVFGALAPLVLPASVLGLDGEVAPSNRLTMGGIGIGSRGSEDLRVFLSNKDVHFVCDADCQRSRREAVRNNVNNTYGNNDCVIYSDMYEVLGRQDIDIVLITTGDRWHTMASIEAAKAGKDIYCEKPCSLTIEESQALSDTIARYGRVYQAGTQRRSSGNFMTAIHYAQSGMLGELKEVHANTLAPATTQKWLPAQPEPDKDECDWDRWLGACPWRPYNSAYVGGGWRNFYDFHGGGILEWGSHTIDLCQLAHQSDQTAPVHYEPWSKNISETYIDGVEWNKFVSIDDGGVVATYDDGVKLVMRTSGWLGLGSCSVRFEGTEGWVETGDSGQIRTSSESLPTTYQNIGYDLANHVRNFLDCVKTRQTTRAHATAAAQSHIAAHAAYIAWQLGRPLDYDPVKNEFINDEEANRMRSRARRQPWHI
ncbi:MAG: Gfo/Idh/MocA family oxidoreductase [Thermoguttaceae bacterium]|nr:Gfo/Idh/MocA family oxidoreductase [Thermoguttaceae bacterium]MBQ1455068.1 Gfo/Idh/MocA family oxidoreductase [Thermoguttaceae bacterium]MBQ6621014.1 Gfo/Idh/MocA family oxidoreductase [Thermoguttaceae bacterium]